MILRNGMILWLTALGLTEIAIGLLRYGVSGWVSMGIATVVVAFVYARVTR